MSRKGTKKTSPMRWLEPVKAVMEKTKDCQSWWYCEEKEAVNLTFTSHSSWLHWSWHSVMPLTFAISLFCWGWEGDDAINAAVKVSKSMKATGSCFPPNRVQNLYIVPKLLIYLCLQSMTTKLPLYHQSHHIRKGANISHLKLNN